MGLNIQTLANNLVTVIINPALLLLFSVGVLVFVWGVVEFLMGLNGIGERKDDGKRHMLYGLAGMFVMASAWAIVQLIAGTVCQGGSLSTCYGGTSSYSRGL